ncbi:hypothetical protein B0H10DRAFT_1949623 [Mycena sp. CBHHK59/15]|nr:hypothetical protein B0H10DRAFT_1062209 [Mycena sp. CBHHK59/15]KAJ6615889.1 hypothetical protein B0H10DRAFT_1949623 [Mycena sp. CBHHK59/15]
MPSDKYQSRDSASSKASQARFIGPIVVLALLNVVIIAILIWRYHIRRRRGPAALPMLIEEDMSPKGVEPPLLPQHGHLSPFPMSPATVAPLRIPRPRPASVYRQSSTSDHPTVAPLRIARRPASDYRQLSTSDHPPSAHPSRTSSSFPPSGHHPPPQRSRTSEYREKSQYQSLSHDRPPSTSYRRPPSTSRREHPPSAPHVRPSPRGTLTPAAARRLEFQVELETALSETVYDKEDVPETPSKVMPPRRRPLRLMSEPRPNSSEYGSSDGHARRAELEELNEKIRQAEAQR